MCVGQLMLCRGKIGYVLRCYGMSCYAAIYVTICAQGQRDRIAAVWRSGEQNNVQPRMVSGSDLSASDLIPDRSAASRRVLLHRWKTPIAILYFMLYVMF